MFQNLNTWNSRKNKQDKKEISWKLLVFVSALEVLERNGGRGKARLVKNEDLSSNPQNSYVSQIC